MTTARESTRPVIIIIKDNTINILSINVTNHACSKFLKCCKPPRALRLNLRLLILYLIINPKNNKKDSNRNYSKFRVNNFHICTLIDNIKVTKIT